MVAVWHIVFEHACFIFAKFIAAKEDIVHLPFVVHRKMVGHALDAGTVQFDSGFLERLPRSAVDGTFAGFEFSTWDAALTTLALRCLCTEQIAGSCMLALPVVAERVSWVTTVRSMFEIPTAPLKDERER